MPNTPQSYVQLIDDAGNVVRVSAEAVTQANAAVEAGHTTNAIADIEAGGRKVVTIIRPLFGDGFTAFEGKLFKWGGAALAALGASGVLAHGANSTGGWVSVLAGVGLAAVNKDK